MKDSGEEKEVEDIVKVKDFLVELGFACNSYPSAQNTLYSKNGDIIIIKNNKE